MVYSDACTHGGPPVDLVIGSLQTLEAFQTRVLEANLFDLPPGTEHFREEQRAADLLMLFRMVQKPEYAQLRSADFARLFMAEAVDCHQRREAIAQAWFCTAFLLSAAARGVLREDAEEVPPGVREQAAEAGKGLAPVLSRWTPCECIEAPPATFPWTPIKTTAAQCVKSKDWLTAIDCYKNVLGMLSAAEESEAAVLAASCFSSSQPSSLQQTKSERARIFSNISHCQLSRGESELALEASLAATQADPQFAKAYGRQARALEALGRPALAAAKQAVQCAEASGEDPSEYLDMCARHASELGALH